MANRPHVPKFGNWENQQNVPYTIVFDKAHKNRTGAAKVMNPNNPKENPDLFSDQESPARAPPPPKPRPVPEEPMAQKPVKRTHDRVKSRDQDGEFKRFTGSPARSENMNQRADQKYGGRGVNLTDTSKGSGAPVHTHAYSGGEGNKGSYHSSSHGSAGGRSRPRPIPNLRDSERAAAIPIFGGWDEHNLGAANGYTGIFEKARKERNHGGMIPSPAATPSRPINDQPSQPNSPKICCFPWSRKPEY